MSTDRELLDQETTADSVAGATSDAAEGEGGEVFEEFTLDDIEVIESKVFG